LQTLAIQHLVDDPATGLRIIPAVPASEIFDQVYRAANSVRWDKAQHAFVMAPWADGSLRTPLEALEQIGDALASECGLRLVLSKQTVWTGISPADAAAIEARLARQPAGCSW
jgi:hypothetical protein